MRAKFLWLWRYYRRYPYVLAVLLIMTPLQAMIAIILPQLLGLTIDYFKNGIVNPGLLGEQVHRVSEVFSTSIGQSFGVLYLLIGLVSVLVYAYLQTHRAWMNVRLERDFRQHAFDDVTAKGPEFFTKYRTGDLVTRMTDDVSEKLSWFACSGIFRFYEALITVGFIIGAMITIDPLLTLFVAGPLPIVVFIFQRSATLLDKRYEQLQSSISRVNDVMESCFAGIRVIKAFTREEAQRQAFEREASKRSVAEIAAVKLATIVESCYAYIWQFGLVIALLAGGVMTFNSRLTLGELSATIYYVTWIVFPMFDIGQFLVKSRQSAVSIDRLVELEQVHPAVAEGERHSADHQVAQLSGGSISFDAVTLQLGESAKPILQDVSLDIVDGQTVAVVGKVGAGKSWLINLLPRLCDPKEGSVKLDGRSISELPLASLRASIGYVPQDPILFSDSIRNNILFGRSYIDEETILWALEIAQFKDDLARLPEGLETFIGTRGVALSGGQKQRLALARALVGKPRILILDDCTSALDSRTESELWLRLREVLPSVTGILITHRPDMLERADMIFVLDQGKLVETGRHRELIDQNGLYASMYRRYQLEAAVS